MLDFIIFAVTFLAVLIIAIIWLYPGSSFVTTVPGLPPTSKQDGNLADVARAGSLHQFLMDLHKRFGSIAGFWVGQTYVVSIASPELMGQQNNVFDRPDLLYKNFEDLIGLQALRYTNGGDARRRRSTYDQCLGKDTSSLYMEYFLDCAKRIEMQWLSRSKDDHIPLSEQAFPYAGRVTLQSILGDYYRDEKEVNKFLEAFHVVWSEKESTIVHPFEQTEESNVKQYEQSLDLIKSSVKKAISHQRSKDKEVKNQLLIDVFIKNINNEEALVSECMDFLVGSYHSTAALITWAVYFIASHPDVQEKLYKEIKSVVGEGGSVEASHISEMIYMMQVIDETLRCAVIAPAAARVQDFDSEIAGHKIPKNTPVIHALGVLSKDEELWPLPNNFDPDRFSPENRDLMSSYAFCPFGFAGKRKCPGQHFTYWDAGTFLATLINKFEISMCDNQVVTPVFSLVTRPQDEIWVKIAKRK